MVQVSARCRAALLVLCLCMLTAVSANGGTKFDLQQAAGGLALTPAGNNYQSIFGTVDALGINAGSTGLTRLTGTTGTLYYTPYQIFVHNNGIPANRHGYLTAYVSSNFTHSAAVSIYSCPSSSTCNAAGNFSPMSTAVGAQTTVVATNPGLVRGQTTTAALGIWLPDNDGPSAYTGNDNATVSLTLIQVENGNTIETLQWQFNLAPAGVTIQSAVRLTLSSHAGGATISATGGSPDYALNFGNVNGLGIGPGAGLTATAVAGGYVYATQYDLNPVFTDFTSTTGTVRVAVSAPFTHPALLQLNDATALTGPFTQILASPTTQITNTAADRSTVTRVLSLFVANTNGAGAFQGSDTSTLTYTLVVP